MRLGILLLMLFTFWAMPSILHAQNSGGTLVKFREAKHQVFGFDHLEYEEWKNDYEQIEINDQPYFVPYKSQSINTIDSVLMFAEGPNGIDMNSLTFRVNKEPIQMRLKYHNGDTMMVVLPQQESDYELEVYNGESLIGKLNVIVLKPRNESVVVVPMFSLEIDQDSLEQYLNSIYIQANLSLSIDIAPLFSPADLDSNILQNPDGASNRYTDQMTMIRDEYFSKHRANGSYYVFLVDGFVNEHIEGYMVRNKGVAFVKFNDTNYMHTVASQLGHGIGALKETWMDDGPEVYSTSNLMDLGTGRHLTKVQWVQIQKNSQSVTYFDDYEDVYTNSGLIAYYFWEEDSNGFIRLTENNFLKSIKRPFKRNQYSKHLDIGNWFFRPIFSVFGYKICALQIIIILILGYCSILFRRKLYRWLMSKNRNGWSLRIGIRFTLLVLFVVSSTYSFLLVNSGYDLFEVQSGKLNYLSSMSIKNTIKTVGDNANLQLLEENKMGSSTFVKTAEDWQIDRRKKVLYFDVKKEGDDWNKYKYKTSSDTLSVVSKGYNKNANSHYIVLSYYNDQGALGYQKIYNHLGKDITNKIELEDPAKRILLFVNGYRPTSLGKTYEDNYADIRKNGLEFPNSKNLIYNFDRYDYWRPWKEIDVLFQKRLNPSESYYADGHFSVSTSNHRSLLTFTTLSAIYPKRCASTNHTCHKTKVSNWWGTTSDVNTYELNSRDPNKKGFKLRKTNGKIAGRNLQQMFNELPNGSSNDTLYIVAHSMGFAYAMGIIEQMRGKISFGGLYIIAPENASEGKVDVSEWNEVWQYGSDFETNKKIAPCLLDGIASQKSVNGLGESNRRYLPVEYSSRMGFYDSHFIGHYTWIFDIPEKTVGHIPQR